MRASSDLGLMMPEIHLFHSRRKFERFCRRKFDHTPRDFGSQGQMTYYDGTVAVLMTHVGKDATELALLVHESWHAASEHMRYLGEDDPGEEVMAYLIQSIAHALFVAHHEWKREKGLVD